MVVRAVTKMMMKVASVNVHNSLVVNQGIEVFGSMFDPWRFEDNGIREMMIA
jgi:hypothetical protein